MPDHTSQREDVGAIRNSLPELTENGNMSVEVVGSVSTQPERGSTGYPATPGPMPSYRPDLDANPGLGYPAQIGVYNSDTQARWFQLHIGTSAPTAGAVPVDVIQVASKAREAFTFPVPSNTFSQGYSAYLSTTELTLTAAGNVGLFFVTAFPIPT